MFYHSQQLQRQLADALENKDMAYQPRTRYLDKRQRPIYTNRLILEDSPYLLQHAHNPVDWFAWNDVAFNQAKAENKPIFLSIGYSTCHWCHVMEEESFDNEDIAKQLNDCFICIKVDRELHPDVDHFYMTCVMMMQGHGGWPMSSFLTPDRKPFLSGTYYQPAQFLILLNRVHQLWQQQQHQILAQANLISQQAAKIMTSKPSANAIDTQVIEFAVTTIMQHYDPQFGGFGSAPKFPNEPYLYFLLEYALYTKRADVLDAVVNSLHKQTCGGLYDQLAGGFHRYTIDQHWLLPHFEKMLYNQANLAVILAQTYQLTGTKDFKRTACETLDYVIREMTDNNGCFYSATDADSDGQEGLFFIWDKQEIEVLLQQDAARFIKLYQVTRQGHFEGKTILHLSEPLQHYAAENNLDYLELIKALEKNKKTLMHAREKRAHPLRDDKILTAWNGMMIKSFAYIGKQFNRQDYIDVAMKAATTLLANNQLKQGLLSRSNLAGQATVPALQEDYAYLAEGLLQLYDANLERQWLVQTEKLVEQMIRFFWDKQNGGFFMAAQTEDSLLPVAPKEIIDNAMGSGNSVAFKVLVRLAKRTAAPHYQYYAEQLLRANAQEITERPFACSYLLCGLLEMKHGEQSNRQWCANGNIYTQAQITPANKVTVHIEIAENWHLVPIQDKQGEMVPVLIVGSNNEVIKNLAYPKPMTKNLGSETKSVYAGIISITFDIVRAQQTSDFPKLIRLKLSLQACNDKSCLPLEAVQLLLFQ